MWATSTPHPTRSWDRRTASKSPPANKRWQRDRPTYQVVASAGRSARRWRPGRRGGTVVLAKVTPPNERWVVINVTNSFIAPVIPDDRQVVATGAIRGRRGNALVV